MLRKHCVLSILKPCEKVENGFKVIVLASCNFNYVEVGIVFKSEKQAKKIKLGDEFYV